MTSSGDDVSGRVLAFVGERPAGTEASEPDIELLIGRKVRQLRTELGWSQADLALKLDEAGWPLHQTNISKLEAGKRPLRVSEAEVLAVTLGISLAALLDRDAAAAERRLRERIAADVARCILGTQEARSWERRRSGS